MSKRLIYAEDAIDAINSHFGFNIEEEYGSAVQEVINALPSVQPEWIPCSERMPDDLEVVNITWINHKPEPYYHDIEDKSFVASGVHYRGKWYWYSTTCADYLGEYGSNEVDLVDDAIEITAWMPLPESYKWDEQNG